MSIVRMTWVGAAGVSAIALFLGGGGCSSSSSGTQAGDSGTGSDGTMGEDSSSQDSGEQADTGTSSGGGDTGTSSGGGDTGTESDTGTVADTGSAGDSSMATDTGSTVDSGTAADTGSTTDGGCSGSAPVDLKLVNYLGWCDLTVAGTALPVPTAGSTVTSHVCVAAGATLSATANGSGFIIGTPPLPFVVGTNTTTDNGSTASTTLASGSTCVVACCPFTDGSGCSGSGVTSLCP